MNIDKLTTREEEKRLCHSVYFLFYFLHDMPLFNIDVRISQQNVSLTIYNILLAETFILYIDHCVYLGFKVYKGAKQKINLINLDLHLLRP